MVVAKRALGDADVQLDTISIKKTRKSSSVSDDPCHALRQAAESNDPQLLQQLLQKVNSEVQADLLAQAPSLVFTAAKNGYLDVVKLLVENVDALDLNRLINVKTEGFRTCLMVAAQQGHLQVVQYLLGAGATMMDRGQEGVCESPLMLAAQAGHLSVVQYLLEVRANWNYRVGRETALMLAAASGHGEVVDCLLDAGSNYIVAYQDSPVDAMQGLALSEASALCSAAAGGHTQIVLRLYNHARDLMGGAPINIDDLSDNLYQTKLIRTPLSAAAEHGHLETVKLLVELLHSDINKECEVDSEKVVALELGAQNGHEEVVKVLLGAGATAGMERAVEKAASAGHWEVVEVMLKNVQDAADLRKRALRVALGVRIMPPQHPAIEERAQEFVKALFEADALIGQGADRALILAAAKHSTDKLQQLLEAGARDHTEALTWAMEDAATDQKFEALERMLSCGLSCDGFSNPKGTVEVAKHCENLLSTMIQAGLKVNVADNLSRTAVSILFKRRDYKSMERLIDAGASTRCLRASQILDLVRLQKDFMLKVLHAGADPTREDDKQAIAFVKARRLKHTARDAQLYNRLVNAAVRDLTVANRFFVGCCQRPHQLRDELDTLLRKVPAIDLNFTHPTTGATPLVALVLANNQDTDLAAKTLKIIKELLGKGADINAHSSCEAGMTPLLAAATVTVSRTAWHDFVAQLIALGADVNARDNQQHTALHYCADWPNAKKKKKAALQVAEVLLKNGADPNLRCAHNKTPLMSAAEKNFHGLVELLLRYGADAKAAVPFLPAELDDLVRQDDLVKQVTSSVGPATSGSPHSNDVLKLEDATEAVSHDGAPVFAEQGAEALMGDTPGEAMDVDGAMQAPDASASVGDVPADFDPDALLGGTTALMCAAAYNAGECVKLLLKAGSDVNARNTKGQTALFQTCADGSHGVADMLIKGGADTNVRDTAGWTPLMYAVAGNFKNLVRRLRVGGASGSMKNPQGQTAYDIAMEHYYPEVAMLVRERA